MLGAADDSDHLPILTKLSLGNLTFALPAPETPAPDRQPEIIRPIAPQHLKLYTSEVGSREGPQAALLLPILQNDIAKLKTLDAQRALRQTPACNRKAELERNNVGKSRVEELGTKVQEMLKGAGQVARKVLPHTKGGPRREFLPLSMTDKRNRRQLATYRRIVRQARDWYSQRHSPKSEAWKPELHSGLQFLMEELPAVYQERLPSIDVTASNQEWNLWASKCTTELHEMKKKKMELHCEQDRKSTQRSNKRFQKRYMPQQKRMNKQIMKKASKHTLTAVLDQHSKKVVTDSADILHDVQNFFQQMANPAPMNDNTGSFLPEEVNNRYPWEEGECSSIDKFKLHSKARSPSQWRICIEQQIQDYSLFKNKLKRLSNNKAPGPDGIHNELLKHLP